MEQFGTIWNNQNEFMKTTLTAKKSTLERNSILEIRVREVIVFGGIKIENSVQHNYSIAAHNKLIKI